jgi:hypothetical protein
MLRLGNARTGNSFVFGRDGLCCAVPFFLCTEAVPPMENE